jgi:hypothetical protein
MATPRTYRLCRFLPSTPSVVDFEARTQTAASTLVKDALSRSAPQKIDGEKKCHWGKSEKEPGGFWPTFGTGPRSLLLPSECKTSLIWCSFYFHHHRRRNMSIVAYNYQCSPLTRRTPQECKTAISKCRGFQKKTLDETLQPTSRLIAATILQFRRYFVLRSSSCGFSLCWVCMLVLVHVWVFSVSSRSNKKSDRICLWLASWKNVWSTDKSIIAH